MGKGLNISKEGLWLTMDDSTPKATIHKLRRQKITNFWQSVYPNRQSRLLDNGHTASFFG